MMQTTTAAIAEVVFEINEVSKEYPGVKALSNITLTGYRGEVLAICGANGAGRSTLAKIIAGQEHPSAGRIWVEGYDSEIRSPANAEDASILLMHEEPLISTPSQLPRTCSSRSCRAPTTSSRGTSSPRRRRRWPRRPWPLSVSATSAHRPPRAHSLLACDRCWP